MGPYVEGMAEVFKDELPEGAINTPFPEKLDGSQLEGESLNFDFSS